MGRKKTPGLYKRGEPWHIDKQVFGERIRESTVSNSLEGVEKILEAANKVCETTQDLNSSTLTLLRCTTAGLIPAQVNVGQTNANTNSH